MTIFSFLTMIGGLAFFLFGMNIMSSNLEKVAGGKLEVVLQRSTPASWSSATPSEPSWAQISARR